MFINYINLASKRICSSGKCVKAWGWLADDLRSQDSMSGVSEKNETCPLRVNARRGDAGWLII